MTNNPTAPEPAPKDKPLRLVRFGFIPLIDCAVPVVAAEMGFARAEGLDLKLQREISWANIRDKVNLGHVDCAQMLAPMPIANSLGMGHVRVACAAPFTLSFNGNAITVGRELYRRMADTGLARDGDPAAMATALARVIAENRDAGGEPFTFGMVFPFSCHNYELRYWLAAGGIHPDWDVRLVVIPPPLIVDSLRAGQIHGFCVGEPWNSLAVEAGVGRIVATKSEIWPHSPEKVLGFPAGWAEMNPDVVASLIRAFDRAAAWAQSPANRRSLAWLIANQRYVGAPEPMIERILAGEIALDDDGAETKDANFIRFQGPLGNRPDQRQALWLYSQMLRWGQAARSPRGEALVRGVFRSDLYDAALGGAPAPEDRSDLRPLFDGRPFDPGDMDGYVTGFPIQADPDRTFGGPPLID